LFLALGEVKARAMTFTELDLNPTLLSTLIAMGYETPTPVQSKAIPLFKAGKDVVVKAQTGTGKTAAFALPILEKIDLKLKAPQAVILAPTRELAMQVADAFRGFAKEMKGLQVATLYGGADYLTQDKALKQGSQVVVGTTGRLMDHMRKKKLKLDALKTMVLDEADEMLRMGFEEDVEWILSHSPKTRQTALFSATMPAPIRKIANKYLNSPVEVNIEATNNTASAIHQSYIELKTPAKLSALKRVLEALEYDGMIIFVRTKTLTLEVADGLKSIGLKVEALNGDIAQAQRKRTVENLRQGKTNIVVATDVAARGIDIQRISCVINYDLPNDVETYIHRIGRTGRAGRKGEAIALIRSSEKRMLTFIERKTKDKIHAMPLPLAKDINKKRCDALMDNLSKIIGSDVEASLKSVLSDFQKTSGHEWKEIALALSRKLDGKYGFLLDENQDKQLLTPSKRKGKKNGKVKRAAFRLEVGFKDGVKPRNIVGAIANEGGISSDTIGTIDIKRGHSVIELPVDLSKQVFNKLKNVSVCGKPLHISKI
jgi:ATP-dependent RNA helicase DeaD